MPPEGRVGETPLATTGFGLHSSLIAWTRCRLGGKPSRTSPGAHRGAAAPSPASLLPLSHSCTSAWAGLGVGHAAVGDVTSVHSPSARVGVYLWSWHFKRAAGLSDGPIYLKSNPDVLQAATCCLELTHWGSCGSSGTALSILSPNSLSKRSKVWIRGVLKVIQQQPKRARFFYCVRLLGDGSKIITRNWKNRRLSSSG